MKRPETHKKIRGKTAKAELWYLIQQCENILDAKAESSFRLTPKIDTKRTFGVWPREWVARINVDVRPIEGNKKRYHVHVEVGWPSYGAGRVPIHALQIAKLNQHAAELALACQAVVQGYTYTKKEAEKAWVMLERVRALDEHEDR